MPAVGGLPRRLLLLLLLLTAIVGVTYVSFSRPKTLDRYAQEALPLHGDTALDKTTLTGHAIAPKLGNETAKQELGRAAWMLFHTTMARFPDKPTTEESAALKSYIHLFQRLYPCGECAEHFGEILKNFPPQVSSRSSAAAWACHVHNEVNQSLKKELFDCANIGDFYDCGCAEGEEKKEGASAQAVDTPKKVHEKPEMSDEAKAKYITNGRDFNTDLLFSNRET